MKYRGIAHRGYPVKYPENTLSSFQAAYDLGFKVLEIDVHLSKDGIPVIMHDAKLERMTGEQGQIKDYTLNELKSFRVQGGETIPTLEETLQLMKGKMTVNIELKQQGYLYPGMEATVLELIEKVDMMDQVYVSSFDHYAIGRFRELSKDIEIGLIISGATPAVFPYMKEIGAKYLAVEVSFITEEYVQICKENDITLIAWTVNSEEQMNRMASYPSVLCTTDELEKFKNFNMSHYE
ncbi:glycerophosphodiester phosphodiesterase [Bacillus sp. FSL K6-3431]|uniref:glycerophosphodiester phosphodiesterase n=1 Tax=Bacillus sp. FSL K6-3431 TaxID=2921500 RepID=UPI0030FBB7EB